MWARGDDVADLLFLVGDRHPIDEQYDELPPLLDRGRFQPHPHALAELLYPCRRSHEVDLVAPSCMIRVLPHIR